MSETESENESVLDFSPSEDEYVPSADADSESDDFEEVKVVDEPSSSSSTKTTKKVRRQPATRKLTEDDDDSDSSVENYLVNPDEIDLASDFFNPNKVVVPDAPQFDCNVGLRLEDNSEEEEEVFEAVPSTSQAVAVKLMDFKEHTVHNKQLADVIETLKNFKANNYGLKDDVTKLLAMGEPSLVPKKKSSQPKRREVLSSSDEADFEEVEEEIKTEKKSNVEVRIGPADKQKTNKLQAELEASIKRKINRRKKENQLTMHKVHLLSWIAYGNHVNKVLNSTKLMEMVVKYIPSEKSYPKDKTDQQYFEQISKWYKTTFGLKSKEQNCPLKCLPPIATSLALQIQSKMAICKKDFVFIFIILLRSIGIQCRLVINLATVPMRPAAKDLCVISTKTTEKSSTGDKAKTDKKSTKTAKVSSQDKKVGKESAVSKSKSISRTNSISGTQFAISMKSPGASHPKKTLQVETVVTSASSQPDDDKRKNLKRSVSVQSSSSINDNNGKRSRIQSAVSSKANEVVKVSHPKKTLKPQAVVLASAGSQPDDDKRKNLKRSVSVQSSNDNNKRSRIQSTGSSKANNELKVESSKQNGSRDAVKNRCASVQEEATSRTSKSSKFNLNKQKSVQSTETNNATEAVESPVSNRTRKAKKPSVALGSLAIPQLDGGDDKKAKKKPKADLFKIKFPLRIRSVSPSSSAASAASSRGRAKSNAPISRLASGSRGRSKSPPSASEHISRKSQFEKTKSDDSSPSDGESSSTLERRDPKSIEPVQTTTKRTKRHTLYTAPTKNSANLNEQLTYETELQENTKPKEVRSESTTQSTAEAMSPLKQVSDRDKKLPSTTKDTKVVSKGATSSTKSSAASERSNSETKSSNPEKRLRSTSEPKSTSRGTASSTTKSAESSKKSDAKTKSSIRTATTPSSSSKPSKSVPSSTSKPSPKPTTSATAVKKAPKRKAQKSASSDSDFAPTPPKKKLSPAVDKLLPKQVERLKKPIDRRILSSDDESAEPAVKKDDMNYWIEVYCETESKWICIDLFKMKVNCVDDIKKKATKPIAYVFAWNNNNKIKDVSPRYCSQWNTTTRKLRVEPDWISDALGRFKEPLSQRCVAEDRELEEIHAQTPIPSAISELKNHPLYVLPRHLLKFEGIYPPNPVPVGFIRDEPIYSRLCVHTLHSREIWVKQARVVKPGEIPYKIVKARPKWDRLANKMLEPQPLEIFGRWQTGPYEPPTAEDGIVPRNAYGNVELFKPEMLPKKTVHLRLTGLNRVCAKLKIDCAQAVVGFDFHGGSSHPTFDGFVVCEEFAELVTEAWCEEQEESYRKAKEKQNQRVYDNWKKLVKGLIIRERLQRKYNFAGKEAAKER